MEVTTGEGYRPLDENGLRSWLATIPEVASLIGGDPSGWTVAEVGDGNLNLVFLVSGERSGVCVKQALPYVRLVGPDWPMPIERAFFEQACMREHGAHVGRLIPTLLHWDPAMFAIVMERLEPHIIMRRGMIAGIRYPRFADDISTYLAQSLFHTSDLALPAPVKRLKVKVFSDNVELCRITEDLIFTDPYRSHPRNRWTSPQLDGMKAEFEADVDLKRAVSRLKVKFLCETQALVHGDLHTGSVMITPEDTRIIDPEFAFFGPMGFDIGAVIGNLLLNYFAQDGHATPDDPREAYQDWVLETVESTWRKFEVKFLDLWRNEAAGDAYPRDLFSGEAGKRALETERLAYMRRLFEDTLGFGAAKMIRRILGLAHNIDLEWIENPDVRALAETRCLRLARRLMVETNRFADISAVTAEARRVRSIVKGTGEGT